MQQFYFKYCYVSLTIQLDISHFFTQLNDQTVLFQTIQFSMSFVCTQFKCPTVLFDSKIGPNQVLPLQAREDLGEMATKGYSAFPEAPGLDTRCGRDAVDLFYTQVNAYTSSYTRAHTYISKLKSKRRFLSYNLQFHIMIRVLA